MAVQKNTYSISPEYLNALKTANLYDPYDCGKISKLSKDRGFREGKGYTNEAIRNFLLRQYTCTLDVLNLITEYYEAKLQLHKQLASKQSDFISKLQEV